MDKEGPIQGMPVRFRNNEFDEDRENGAEVANIDRVERVYR